MSNIRIVPTIYRSTLSMSKLIKNVEPGLDIIDENVNTMIYSPDGGLPNTSYNRSFFVYVLCDEKIQKGDWFMYENGDNEIFHCVDIEDGTSVGINEETPITTYEYDSSVRLYHHPKKVKKIKYTNDTQNCPEIERVSDSQMKSIVNDINK